MSQHVSKRSGPDANSSAWSPWRRHKRPEPSSDDFIYDLYAVCNHYGNMQGGHYTGRLICKMSTDFKLSHQARGPAIFKVRKYVKKSWKGS